MPNHVQKKHHWAFNLGEQVQCRVASKWHCLELKQLTFEFEVQEAVVSPCDQDVEIGISAIQGNEKISFAQALSHHFQLAILKPWVMMNSFSGSILGTGNCLPFVLGMRKTCA